MFNKNNLVYLLEDSKKEISNYINFHNEPRVRDIIYKMSSLEKQLTKMIKDLKE